MSKPASCPLCRSEKGSLIHRKEKEKVSWLRCEDCSIVYKSAETSETITDEDYYRAGRMRETVPYRYGDASSVTPEIAFEEKYEISMDRYLKVKEHINRDSAVMEIGCGAGGFLYMVRPMVSRCVGVELDTEMVEFCRERLNLDVRDKALSQCRFDGDGFDLISMFHVLEHFADPKSFLMQVIEHLKPGGRLAIEVPCFNEALLQAFGLKKYREIYFTIHHELYFTERSLRRLLNECGVTPQFQSFNHYGIANHLNWLQNDSPVKGASRQSGSEFQVASIQEPEKNAEFVNDLNQWLKSMNSDYKELLSSHGFFDTIFCVAQKGKDATGL